MGNFPGALHKLRCKGSVKHHFDVEGNKKKLATAGASDSALLLTLCALQITILLLLVTNIDKWNDILNLLTV